MDTFIRPPALHGAIKPSHLVRSAVAAIEATLFKGLAEDILRKRYGDDGEHVLRVLRCTAPSLLRAAQSPASSLMPGYAAELVQQTYGAWLDLMKSEAIFAQIPWTSAPIEGGKVLFPSRDDSAAFPANEQAMWRKEGDPIRVGHFTTKTAELVPYTPAVISHFTNELFQRSTPNIETVVRQAIVEDSAEAFDRALFSNAAAVADVRPAGLLNGLPAGDTRISSGTTFAQIDTDLMAMVKQMAVNRRGRRLWWVMSEANKIALSAKRNTTSDLTPYRDDLLVSQPTLLTIPVATSLTFPSTEVYLVDAEAVALVGGAPEWEVSTHATIHEESETPLPISGATPVRSLFQTNSAAVRAIYTISWGALRSHPIQQLTAVAW